LNLALFDFDGTITYKDSMIEFLKFNHGQLYFWTKLIAFSPVLTLLWLGLISNHKAKELLLGFFIGGTAMEDFQKSCDEFALSVIPKIVRKNAFQQLCDHRKNGDRVLIITASAENWLKQWCNSNGLELIATELQVVDGRITGKIKGKNCNGAEKVERLRKYLSLSEYHEIFAYGDNKGDKELLGIATRPLYRHF
jgi:HAD superfamily hydrolase (TIGR01490 family)